MHRKSLSYVLAKKEKLPKLVLSFLLFFLFIIVTFKVAHYVFVLKSNGEHVEGYVYKTLLVIFKLLRSLFL
jgi:E3 ubiquitin-protein ligase DOA10